MRTPSLSERVIAKMRKQIVFFLIALSLVSVPTHAQFVDCSTGLLQMPTAEMQQDGTFMITNNFLNKHSLPTSGWGYNTFQYGFAISMWGRIEMGYVCTIFNDHWKGSQSRYDFLTTGLRFFVVYGPAGRPDMAYFGFTPKITLREGLRKFAEWYKDYYQ